MNLDLLSRLRSDVELYRCRGTIVDAPHYRQYLTLATGCARNTPSSCWKERTATRIIFR